MLEIIDVEGDNFTFRYGEHIFTLLVVDNQVSYVYDWITDSGDNVTSKIGFEFFNNHILLTRILNLQDINKPYLECRLMPEEFWDDYFEAT